ncbi:proteasomal ubiquitin receptor ADRM1 [Ctenocephalides felis]|uniref:proteasomal ubiquitin receptor ADRM1 n=1 Tax=Ctenocephalides felis TaxID=7515 RepID=UPI000E6E3D86|nr:proteasomal ubiquitin receptor ADRM1 [Ctenocephalides felis]
MPSGALFGNSHAIGGSSGGVKHLVEFRAGRMTLKDKMVEPDKRKGFLYLYQSDDSLIHFCWKDRTTGVVEDDLIIFPDDCEFVKVSQCTTGRVYVLKFKTSSRKLFFWMQEPKTDKDDEWCRRINEILNNPPSMSGFREPRPATEGELQNLLNSMSQQQLMQLFGGVGERINSILGPMGRRASSRYSTPASQSNNASGAVAASPDSGDLNTTDSTKPSATSDGKTKSLDDKSTPTRHPIQLSDLQSYLSTLTSPDGQTGTNIPSSQQSVDLASALNVDALQTVIKDDERVAVLEPHLPPAGQEPAPSRELLRDTLASPQFHQAVSMFSNALQSGQLGPVVSQFDVNTEAVTAANKGDIEEFVKALEGKPSKPEKKESEDSAASTDKKDKEDGTSLG